MEKKKSKLLKLVKRAPKVSKIIRGTLIKRWTLCGNKNCKCYKKGRRHGPNYYLVYSENKKTHHVYIPKNKVKIIKEYVNNYNAFWKILNEISKLNIRIVKEGGE